MHLRLLCANQHGMEGAMEKIRLSPRLGLYYGCPVILVTCQGPSTKPNIITVAAAGVMCANPPLVGVGVSCESYSHELMETSGEWVLNLPFAHQAELADYCGSVSGRTVDKFESRGLTAVESEMVSVPRIAECPVNFECACFDILRLGSHDWFVGEIVSVHVAQTLYDESAGLNVHRASPMVWLAGGYWRVGDMIGRRGMSSKG